MQVKNCDLCVVGAAGSGMAAAIVARQQGVENVILLEKQKAPGGCTGMSAGMMGLNTPVQKRAGIHYDVDQAFRDLMYLQNWSSDAKLVRKWLNGSGKNFEWLEDLGIRYNFMTTETAELDRFRNTHNRMGDWDEKTGKWKFKMQGPILVKGLREACEKYGVQILTSTRAKHLLQDEAKTKVTGVVAETENGEELQINAKAVILATGSISGNRDLIKRFYNSDEYGDIHIMANVPHNTGDGLIMAEEIGASSGPVGTLFIGPHNHYAGASELVGMMMRRAQPVKINILGERYVDESMPFTWEFGWMQCVATDKQPGKRCYIVMDQKYIDQVIAGTDYMPERTDDASQLHKPPVFGPPIDIEKGKDPDKWRERVMDHFHYEEARGIVKICNTLEEVAAFIGCDVAALRQTMEHYNECCHTGYDDEFLKDKKYLQAIDQPPYYVIRGESGMDSCLGGLKIDNHQRVLRKDGTYIPGLYAAGIMCSGWFNGTYSFFGSEMSFVIYSGRTSGEEAAAYLKK